MECASHAPQVQRTKPDAWLGYAWGGHLCLDCAWMTARLFYAAMAIPESQLKELHYSVNSPACLCVAITLPAAS